ncbi:M20 metallopeptidase family protein [Sulfobacillus thermosulfidooxidans]|uniref:M20 metallopeptidase family protein n=1 Tax=Sulfobacillus thermosulfidooxidans TaxID=28034 RepID=UPI000403F0D2|nr:amidohydrolase [Sulfobacillus thermosulfidooxidans]
MSIQDDVLSFFPQLVQWRRHLHAHPELSFKEYETQQYLIKELERIGLTPRVMGHTGVVVDIGKGPGGVAIRADIDALPIQEESNLPFKSVNDGVMHACGHDGHTAILLGVAALLAQQESSLPGRIRLMFQPAEEKIPGGARLLIEDGVLDDIDYVLGLHLSSDMPTGTVGAVMGAQTANADWFTIDIEGRGGHGSQPHLSIDPIVVGSELVLAIQSIVSRNINPRRPVVVTVGTFQSGANFNIIAPRARLTGTVRTFSSDDRDKTRERLAALVQHVSAAHEAQAHLEYHEGYPSVMNSVRETFVAKEVANSVLGSQSWVDIEPLMAGEDFSYYQQLRPGTFLMLGCRNEEQGAIWPHHHPQFTVDENALPLGVAMLIETARQYLQLPKDQYEGADI